MGVRSNSLKDRSMNRQVKNWMMPCTILRRVPFEMLLACWLLLFATLGCDKASLRAPDPHWQAAFTCGARSEGSRWAPGGRPVVATDTAGRGEELWFGDVVGIDATPKNLYLFDISRSQVLVLNDRLDLSHTFGREGGGPGEFTTFPVHQAKAIAIKNWLSVHDSDLVVFDTDRISLFSTEGTFKRYLNADGVSLSFWPFQKIEFTDDGALVLRDLLMDVVGGFKPEMELWKLGQQDPRLITTVGTVPAPNNRPDDQTVPSAALSDHCAYFTDGSRDSVIILQLATGDRDTLPLPHIHPAHRKVSTDISEAEREALKKLSRMSGFSLGSGKKDPPTALWWWTEIIADPDGYLWLRLWTPSESLYKRSEALVINPDDGTWQLDTIPGFPRAFGRPGVYYREMRDPEDGTPLVVRYEAGGMVR